MKWLLKQGEKYRKKYRTGLDFELIRLLSFPVILFEKSYVRGGGEVNIFDLKITRAHELKKLYGWINNF